MAMSSVPKADKEVLFVWDDTVKMYQFRDGTFWTLEEVLQSDKFFPAVKKELAEIERQTGRSNTQQTVLTGKAQTGNHYYRVQVVKPMSPELQSYSAECADIIEALGMSFNEGECFKALWRLAAARQGRGKPGNAAVYDAEKIAHYGSRVLAQVMKAEEKDNGNTPSTQP